MHKSLQVYIDLLEKEGELIRIKEFVDPHLEMSEIIDRQVKQEGGGKAILFENTGSDFPVLSNYLGSEKRIAMALSSEKLSDLADELKEIMLTVTEPKNSIVDKLKVLPLLGKFASWMPKSKSGKGACQEIINKNPDLSKLPVLTTWPLDGGKFITFPLVHTKNPSSGIRNLGMYRMQVLSEKSTGMHWHRHKTGANHFNEYKKLGKRMPISVALGGDPVYTYAASAPLPEDIDEYILAGFLRKKKVELVKCITNDIEVPADADIVIEGYVDPAEGFVTEGPFGDHTGFYSLKDKYPVFHITCITHKKKAIYPTTLVGIPPMEDAYMALATEKIFNFPIQMTMVPEMIDLHMPIEGVAHNITNVQIQKKYPGQALKTANSLWGAGQMMFNKVQIIVDQHTPADDYKAIFDRFINELDISTDINFSTGPMDVLDHSSQKFSFGSKLMLDLTTKLEEEKNSYYSNKFQVIPESKKEINILNYHIISGKKNKIAFVAIDKSEIKAITETIYPLFNHKELKEVNIIFAVEKHVRVEDLSLLTWIISSNIDPLRDLHFAQVNGEKKLLIDSLNKTKEVHQFDRDWPNVVIMDDQTIETVNKKWDSYKIGKFIESPSLKYKCLFEGELEKIVSE